MAVNPGVEWPAKTTPPSAAYPYASSQDETAPGANDGTPYEVIRANDIFGFQQAMLKAADIVPSGNADSAFDNTSSQYMQAVLHLVAASTTFTDIGAADAYDLEAVGNNPAPADYTDNMTLFFIAANTNTGASTVDVEGKGVKDIVIDGVALTAGNIIADERMTLRFDLANDRFELVTPPPVTSQALPIGTVVQQVYAEDGAVAVGSTAIPLDNTIPQDTEGDEFLSVAITPLDATNTLLIEIQANLSVDGLNRTIIGALFQDGVSDALSATALFESANDKANQIILRRRVVAGGVAPITFKFKAGSDNGNDLTLNGLNAAGLFGGVYLSSITVTEIKA